MYSSQLNLPSIRHAAIELVFNFFLPTGSPAAHSVRDVSSGESLGRHSSMRRLLYLTQVTTNDTGHPLGNHTPFPTNASDEEHGGDGRICTIPGMYRPNLMQTTISG